MIFHKSFLMFSKFLVATVFIMMFCVNLHAKDKIVFGLTGTVYKGDLEVFQRFKRFLEKNINANIELKFSRTYAEMVTMIDHNEVDLAYVCNTTYVKLENEGTAKLLSIPITNTGNVYFSYVIAKKESSYDSLTDFKDKLFAYTDPDSNSGALAPTYELLQKSIKPKKFFGKIIYTYEHGESINAVLDGFVDGASVDSLVYDQFVKRYPKEAAQIKVVQKLGPFVNSPIVANSALNQEYYEKIQHTLINMHQTKEGEAILNELSLKQLQLPQDASYSQIRKMLEYIEREL